MESKVKTLRETIQGDDKGKIQNLINALQNDLQTIGQTAYQQQGAPDQTGGPQDNGHGNDEDVVEGEFREA